MDELRIDNHKLIYHISRVYQWLQGKNIYPIYMEITPYGGCNHRCIFCALDYLGYKPNVLNNKYLKKLTVVAAKKGVKSILYAGEGEPLLHRNIAEIVRFTKENGIDVAITSNAVMFSEDLAEKSLSYLSWFRASIDAGTPETYARIHQAKRTDFNIVLKNLKNAVRIRNNKSYNCTIGAQFLLIPQNYSEAAVLASKLKDIGLDYLIIKPYSQHPSSGNRIGHKFKYKDLFYLEKELAKYSKDNFQIIFRRHSMEKLEEEPPYKKCLGLPFMTIITSTGDVYPCNVFLGKEGFIFGNIYNEDFKDIWEGKQRKRVMDIICNKWDISTCRRACRLDEINRYLWELKNPNSHVNFI